MDSLFPFELLQTLQQSGVAAVLVLDDPDAAVPIARALLDGGVSVVELTLRTPAAFECIRNITQAVPEMKVGAGTVLTTDQADQASSAGAQFAVAPGTNVGVIRHATHIGLPFAPGVMTPTDIDIAVQCGCRELKFFPAVPSGGIPLLKSLAAPFRHLGLRYIPLGGVGASNLKEWISEPDVLTVGGSWLVPADSVASGDWHSITRNAAEAVQIVADARHGGDHPG